MGNAVGQATNKLGELFVDIGVGGLGQTLKALNSVSATFLLTKNAATQLVKPIVDMGIQTANSAVGIGKMAAALGTTTIKAQKLQYYLKQYGAQGAENSIANLQQTLNRALTGYGGIDGQMAMSMGELGLDWNNYDGSIESIMQLVQDVKNAFKKGNVSKVDQLKHLQNIGLDTQFAYLFEKDDFDINKSLNISDNTIKDLQKAAEATEKLKNDMDLMKMKLMGKLLDGGLLDKLENLVDISNKYVNGDKETQTNVNNTLVGAGVVGTGAVLGGIPGAAVTGAAVLGASQYNKNAKSIGGFNYTPIGGGQLDLSNNPFTYDPKKNKPINVAALNDNALPSLPNIDNSTTINVKNVISGSNVKFEEMTATEENALTGGRSIEVNQYVSHNTTDL